MTTFMLALCALLLRLIVLSHVSAIPWEGPRATGVDDIGVGWTPLPTDTPGGSLELVKRAGQYPITVCGFIGGDLAIPATCSSGSSCVWFSDYSVIGCCTTSGNACTVPTSCIDKNSPKNTAPDDPMVFTCRSECYTNSFPQGYSEIGCGYSSWATFVGTNGAKDVSLVITTSPGTGGGSPAPGTSAKPSAAPSSSNTPSATSSSSPQSSSPSSSAAASSQASSATSSSPSTSSAPSSSAGSSPSSSASSSSRSSGAAGGIGSTSDPGASTTGTSSTSSTSSSAAPVSTDPGSHSNVGAIAGGVGGGVAAIAVAAGLVTLLLRRRKRRARNTPHGTPSSFRDDKHFSHNTGTTYGSPSTMDTPVMAPFSPDAYARPGSYEYGRMHNGGLHTYSQRPDSAAYPQQYQPYRPPPVELPNEPAMRYELPAR